jgi:hypothetical protein
MTQRVEFVEIKGVRHRRTLKTAYAVNEKRRAVWLQRFCCWVLGKLGAFYDYQEITAVRHRFDSDTFMERIFKNETVVREFNCEPKELLIGPEQFSELMGSPEIHNYLTFQTTYHKGRKILGLTVRVIPWMDGILVVP